MSRIAISCAMGLLAAGCSKEEMRASPRDVAWAIRAAEGCPAVAGLVKSSLRDGSLSIADLEGVNGALTVAVANPVKGQVCDVKYVTPTTTRDVQEYDGMTMVGKVPMSRYRTIEAQE
jgi:hypothetical protein